MLILTIYISNYNEYMHSGINPIEKHKSEIQRRINQLESKFKERGEIKKPQKRLREIVVDENKMHSNQIASSKTVDVRNRNKAPGEIARIKRQYLQEPHPRLNDVSQHLPSSKTVEVALMK